MSNYGRTKFGKELVIPADSATYEDDDQFHFKIHGPCVSVLIGIGKDHVGHLIMDKAAHEAFLSGEEIHITKDFDPKPEPLPEIEE